jgi:hypothetical protein
VPTILDFLTFVFAQVTEFDLTNNGQISVKKWQNPVSVTHRLSPNLL